MTQRFPDTQSLMASTPLLSPTVSGPCQTLRPDSMASSFALWALLFIDRANFFMDDPLLF